MQQVGRWRCTSNLPTSVVALLSRRCLFHIIQPKVCIRRLGIFLGLGTLRQWCSIWPTRRWCKCVHAVGLVPELGIFCVDYIRASLRWSALSKDLFSLVARNSFHMSSSMNWRIWLVLRASNLVMSNCQRAHRIIVFSIGKIISGVVKFCEESWLSNTSSMSSIDNSCILKVNSNGLVDCCTLKYHFYCQHLRWNLILTCIVV